MCWEKYTYCIVYINVDRGRDYALNFVLSGEKYYFDDEIIVAIGDVCSRMGPLGDSSSFTLDG